MDDVPLQAFVGGPVGSQNAGTRPRSQQIGADRGPSEEIGSLGGRRDCPIRGQRRQGEALWWMGSGQARVDRVSD